MGVFRLEPGILGTASERMQDISADMSKATDYLTSGPGAVSAGDGLLWGIFMGGHRDLVSKFETVCVNAMTLTGAVQENLSTVQGRYDATEEDNLVEVGTIFGTGDGDDPGIDETGSATTFGTELASAKLTTPVADQQIPEVAQHLIAMGTMLISPTYWLNKMIGAVMAAAGIGTTPIDYVTQQVSGDWQAVGEASDGFAKLADFFEKNASLIRDDAGVLLRGWDGEASDRAERYFDRLIQAFSDQGKPFEQAAKKYDTMAWSSSAASLALGSLLAILGDALLVAAAAAALVWAGGVSAAIVIAALKIAFADWLAILKVIGWMTVGVYAVVAVCAALGGAVSPVDTVPMPTEV